METNRQYSKAQVLFSVGPLDCKLYVCPPKGVLCVLPQLHELTWKRMLKELT